MISDGGCINSPAYEIQIHPMPGADGAAGMCLDVGSWKLFVWAKDNQVRVADTHLVEQWELESVELVHNAVERFRQTGMLDETMVYAPAKDGVGADKYWLTDRAAILVGSDIFADKARDITGMVDTSNALKAARRALALIIDAHAAVNAALVQVVERHAEPLVDYLVVSLSGTLFQPARVGGDADPVPEIPRANRARTLN